jgi:hypothetical protein
MRRNEPGVRRGAPRFLFSALVMLVLLSGAHGTDDSSSAAGGVGDGEDITAEENDIHQAPSLIDHLTNAAAVLMFMLLTRPAVVLYLRALATQLSTSEPSRVKFVYRNGAAHRE